MLATEDTEGTENSENSRLDYFGEPGMGLIASNYSGCGNQSFSASSVTSVAKIFVFNILALRFP